MLAHVKDYTLFLKIRSTVIVMIIILQSKKHIITEAPT